MSNVIPSGDRFAGIQPAASTGRQTVHEYVREALRLAILNGVLTGGTRLVQSDLAAELEVSTTPVREALRDLAADGLVRIDAQKGAVVSELDEEDLREVYMIRERVEPLALELAMPNLTDEILDRCEALHKQMSDAPSSGTWVQLNRQFHMTIYEASSHDRLVSLVRSLQDESVMAVSATIVGLPEIREVANLEHGELLAALRDGDLDRAKAAVMHHVTLSIRPDVLKSAIA